MEALPLPPERALLPDGRRVGASGFFAKIGRENVFRNFEAALSASAETPAAPA